MWEVRGIGRAWVGVILWPALLVGCLGIAVDDWCRRDDPTVWGQFVRTSDPCSGRGCSTTGDWRPDGDGQARHGVLLVGETGVNGRVRAAYRGPWPVSDGEDISVQTQASMRREPWLDLGVAGGVVVALAVDLRTVRRHRRDPAPATVRRPGAHRPADRARAILRRWGSPTGSRSRTAASARRRSAGSSTG